ncbi:MAG: hypothetical protein Harvfovirus4_30 [Harvfovirus sp.]|uniref:Uncharacterized protein n=1 Tax=Harvfovirus sp. TaxID=2487768 RepID=A0A3G5A0B8_9VIRU|nr:MAG: hypothetical protein Harvfovirus4_30 [Harvfovirus sp.]
MYCENGGKSEYAHKKYAVGEEMFEGAYEAEEYKLRDGCVEFDLLIHIYIIRKYV